MVWCASGIQNGNKVENIERMTKVHNRLWEKWVNQNKTPLETLIMHQCRAVSSFEWGGGGEGGHTMCKYL